HPSRIRGLRRWLPAARAVRQRVVRGSHARSHAGRSTDLSTLRPSALGSDGSADAPISGEQSEGQARSARLFAGAVRAPPGDRARTLPCLLRSLATARGDVNATAPPPAPS